MRAHVIKNGVVINTIEVESLDFMPGLVNASEGGIGWSYIDGKFVDNRPVALQPVSVLAPTKDQLLAEVRVLMAKIRALA